MNKLKEIWHNWSFGSEEVNIKRLSPMLLSLLMAIVGVSLFIFSEPSGFLSEFKRLLNDSATLTPYTDTTAEITVFRPFTYLIFWVLNAISKLFGVGVVWGLYVLFCLSLLWLAFRKIASKSTPFILLICPIFISIWGGDVELLVVGLVCLGLSFIYRLKYCGAMICFALSSAVMPESALFALLFLRQKRWQELLLGVGLYGVLSLLGLLLLEGSFQELRYLITAEHNMREYIYVYKEPDSINNYSMLMIWQLFTWPFAFRVVLFLFTLFGWMIGILMVVKAWLTKSWLQAVSGISLIFVLLPLVSTHGRLLFLLPILLFAWQKELKLKYQILISLALGFVWLPIPECSLIVTSLLTGWLFLTLLKKTK